MRIAEYSVADLRGKSDEACVGAMLAISDARFVDGLAAAAVDAEKFPREFKMTAAWRLNTPKTLSAALASFAASGLLPEFPFGSDFSAIERRPLRALLWLKQQSSQRRHWPALIGALIAPGTAPGIDECHDRLQLGRRAARSLREWLFARLVRAALVRAIKSGLASCGA